MPNDQACQRECDVERMLNVVIARVDCVVIRVPAGIHPLEVVESHPYRIE